MVSIGARRSRWLVQDKVRRNGKDRPSLSSSSQSGSGTDPRQFMTERTLLISNESGAGRAHERQEGGEKDRGKERLEEVRRAQRPEKRNEG